MSPLQIMAGTATADITPPLEVGLLTSSVKGLYEPFGSVRLPLKARVLVLRSPSDTVALVSLDLLALNDTSVSGWEGFKRGMSDAIPPEKVILTVTHTHNAPESVALSGLYLTSPYKNWLAGVQQKIKRAIATATGALRPCGVSLATGILNGHSLQRRIPTPQGIMMSDSMQPIPASLMERGPVDRRVRTIRLHTGEGATVATIVHAICHPVHEMCMTHISSDYPGEMCRELERSPASGMPLFLNGAAGDINPPTVSCGPASAQEHGQALAEVVREGANRLQVDDAAFQSIHSSIQLGIREGSGMHNKPDAVARFSAIRLGPLAIVFLPGEPFVETALHIEQHSPFAHTIVAGFGENNIGYIPTREALQQGGYEAGPGKWSYMKPGADEAVAKEALRLLNTLFNKR